MKHEIKAVGKITLTDQDVEDLMVAALEGGIGYWACLDNSSATFWEAPDDEPVAITATKILLGGGGLTFLDEEERQMDKGKRGFKPAKEYVLTLKKLMSGIEKYLNTQDGFDKITYGSLDLAYVDADAADIIIQLALFGEVMFG